MRVGKQQPVMAPSARVLGYRAVQVLAFVSSTVESEGCAPSYRMICNEFNLDRGNVSRLIARLEKRGLLERAAGTGQMRRIKLAL